MKNYHLAILKAPYLEAILTGRKKVESRFTATKRTPFGQIEAGDRIFFKLSCGPVCAVANAAAVKTFENLTPAELAGLKKQYNHLICGSEEYWQSRAGAKFGLLVWLDKVESIRPIRIRKTDMRAWVVLSRAEDFGLLARKC